MEKKIYFHAVMIHWILPIIIILFQHTLIRLIQALSIVVRRDVIDFGPIEGTPPVPRSDRERK